MTNEQREAIDNLSEIVKLSKEELQKENENITAILDYKDLNTVLSLIKQQQRKIENITTNYEDLIADVSGIAKELGLEEDATIDEIYIAISILKSKRINVIEQLDCIQKKDKQIDLMAFNLADYVMNYEYDKCRNPEMIKNKAEEIKQYFADKVNSSEQN